MLWPLDPHICPVCRVSSYVSCLLMCDLNVLTPQVCASVSALCGAGSDSVHSSGLPQQNHTPIRLIWLVRGCDRAGAWLAESRRPSSGFPWHPEQPDWFKARKDITPCWWYLYINSVGNLFLLSIIIIIIISLSQVISEQWDGVLGRCDITVTSNPVTPGDLSVQVVSGLGMSVTGSPVHSSIITTTVTAYNILYNQHQVRECSFMMFEDRLFKYCSHCQFSDKTAAQMIRLGYGQHKACC